MQRKSLLVIFCIGTLLTGLLVTKSFFFLYAKDYLLDRSITRRFLYAVSDPAAHTRTSEEIGDGGPATAAVFKDPTGLYIDAHGNLFVAER